MEVLQLATIWVAVIGLTYLVVNIAVTGSPWGAQEVYCARFESISRWGVHLIQQKYGVFRPTRNDYYVQMKKPVEWPPSAPLTWELPGVTHLVIPPHLPIGQRAVICAKAERENIIVIEGSL